MAVNKRIVSLTNEPTKKEVRDTSLRHKLSDHASDGGKDNTLLTMMDARRMLFLRLINVLINRAKPPLPHRSTLILSGCSFFFQQVHFECGLGLLLCLFMVALLLRSFRWQPCHFLLEEERPIVYVCVPMPVLNSFSYHDTTSGVGLAFRSSYRVVWYGLCSHWDGLREFEVKSYRVRS